MDWYRSLWGPKYLVVLKTKAQRAKGKEVRARLKNRYWTIIIHHVGPPMTVEDKDKFKGANKKGEVNGLVTIHNHRYQTMFVLDILSLIDSFCWIFGSKDENVFKLIPTILVLDFAYKYQSKRNSKRIFILRTDFCMDVLLNSYPNGLKLEITVNHNRKSN